MGQNLALFHKSAQPPCSTSVEATAPLLAMLKRPATILPWPPVYEAAAVPDSAALHMLCPPWTLSSAVTDFRWRSKLNQMKLGED
jgi:hypothetical protein